LYLPRHDARPAKDAGLAAEVDAEGCWDIGASQKW